MRDFVDWDDTGLAWALDGEGLGEVSESRVWVSGRPDIFPWLVVFILVFSEHELEVILGDELRSNVLLSGAFLGSW